MMDAVRDFFTTELSNHTAKLSDGKDLLLTRVQLKMEDINDQNVLVSKIAPTDSVYSIMNDLVAMKSSEHVSTMFPDMTSWEINHKNKTEIINLVEEHLNENVSRQTLKQKIYHCLEELSSNAIYALNPVGKSNEMTLENEKPVSIHLDLKSNPQVLIIKDNYGAIDQVSKSRILVKVSKDVIAPRMDRSRGGAGVGVNLVKEFCDFFVIRQRAGEWTETCCFFIKGNKSETPVLFLEV